jgi:hypothetical protein
MISPVFLVELVGVGRCWILLVVKVFTRGGLDLKWYKFVGRIKAVRIKYLAVFTH